MLNNIGVPGLILVLIIALVIFGPSKLPEIGRAFGRTLSEFKKSAKELTSDIDETIETEKTRISTYGKELPYSHKSY